MPDLPLTLLSNTRRKYACKRRTSCHLERMSIRAETFYRNQHLQALRAGPSNLSATASSAAFEFRELKCQSFKGWPEPFLYLHTKTISSSRFGRHYQDLAPQGLVPSLRGVGRRGSCLEVTAFFREVPDLSRDETSGESAALSSEIFYSKTPFGRPLDPADLGCNMLKADITCDLREVDSSYSTLSR